MDFDNRFLIILLFLLLTFYSLAEENTFFQRAQDLLNEYPEYEPPAMGTKGRIDQTVEESWIEYYRNQAEQNPLRETGDICVKVMPTYYCWPNESVTLWGNVSWENYSGSGTYYWDFGDGTQSEVLNISNQRYLNTTHSYSTMDSYIATLVVEDDLGQIASQSTRVVVMNMNDARVKKAVEDGLRYLYLEQYADGHWYGGYSYSPAPEIAATSLAILSFEENGHLPWLSPQEDIYKEVVIRGFNWLWNEIDRTIISQQPAGDPDTDGNGYGYHFSDDRSTYSDPMALLAIITSGSPDQVVESGPAWVQGHTYYQIAQNIVDQMLYSQTETGNYRGGWRYKITSADYGSSDTSTTQWPVLGFLAAQNWDISIPEWAWIELSYWLDYIQSTSGSFGYDSPATAGNLARTGSGLTTMYALGHGIDSYKYTNAINWLANNYTMNDGYSGIYGIYSLYKGLWFYDMLQQQIGSYNWYEDYTNYLLGTQASAGSWSGSWGGTQLNTSFGVLVLTPRVIIPNESLAIALRNVNTDNFPYVTIFADVFSNGQALTGLNSTDFLVTEDGVLQDISIHYEFDQYLITYMSTTPYPSSSNRIVIAEVTAQVGGEEFTEYDDIIYTYQEHPVIQRTDTTINLSYVPQPAGQSISIAALIYDSNEPYINTAVLHWRTAGSAANYSEITMFNVSDNYWLGITESNVQSPGIEYFITASDGSIVISDPANSPMAYPYHIPVDNLLPQITHTPVIFAEVHQPISIIADVEDESDSLANVLLHYKPVDSYLWNYCPMLTDRESYSSIIPAEFMEENGISYFISAIDNYGLTAYDGTYEKPHRIVNAMRGNFRGTVTEEATSLPIREASINLISNGEVIRIVNSDNYGNFVIYNVQEGNYTLRASKAGYINANSGNLHISPSIEIIYDFVLAENSGIDLCLNTLSIVPAVDQEEPLVINALVNNLGATIAPAAAIVIQEKDLTLPTQPVSNIYQGILPELGSGEYFYLEVPYAASSSYLEITVAIDPDNLVEESDKSNNVMSTHIQFSAPVVNSVTALYDGDPNPDVIGRFISLSGINIPPSERVKNLLTAGIYDPEGCNNIDRVEFDINGIIHIDDNPSGGWSIEYDMSQLPPHSVPLIVTAYDKTGLASQPMLKTISMFAAPDWLDYYILDISQQAAAGYESGSFYFDLILNSQDSGGDIYDYAYTIDNEIDFIGSLYSSIAGGVKARLYVPLDITTSPQMTGSFMIDQAIMGGDANVMEIPISFTINQDYELAALDFEFTDNAELLEIGRGFTLENLFTGSSSPISLGLDIFGDYTYTASFADDMQNFTFNYNPAIHSNRHNALAISLCDGLAATKAVISPELNLDFQLEYGEQSGFDSDTIGDFAIDYHFLLNYFWQLYDNCVIMGSYGNWIIGEDGRYEREGLAIPHSLPYSKMVSDTAGNIAIVWISDKDEQEEIINPEIDFKYKPAGSDWLEAETITDNDLFESSPDLSFMSDGRLIAVWIANTITQTEANQMQNISPEEILAAQDIYYSLYEYGIGWSEPAAIISDDAGNGFADGEPAVSFSSQNQGLVLWTRSENSLQPLSDGALEIYYSVMNDDLWSEPVNLTAGLSNDFEPAVCYGEANQAMALWHNDADSNLLTEGDNEIFFSIWDGFNWTNAQNLTNNNVRELSHTLVKQSNGNFLAAWVEVETYPDNTQLYSISANIWDADTSTWGTTEVLYSHPYIIEELVINIDSRDIVCLLFRGYDGFDGEIFFTSKELAEPNSNWTIPAQQTADDLTHWLIASAIDNNDNLYYVNFPYDFTDSSPESRGRGRGDFADGLSLISHGIRDDGTLRNNLNYGVIMIACDLEINDEDLVITGIDNPNIPEADTLMIEFTLYNHGNVTANNFSVHLFDGNPTEGELLDITTIEALPPDEDVTLQYEWQSAAGAHQFTVLLDSTNALMEIDESNNIASRNINIFPDLTIEEVSVSDYNPLAGSDITITALAANLSGAIAENIAVSFYADNILIDSILIESLQVGDTEAVTLAYTATTGINLLKAIVNADSTIPEEIYANNSIELSINVNPDLEILNSDLSYNGNGILELTGLLLNNGGVPAQNVSFQFWQGNPSASGSTKIGETLIEIMPPFSVATVNMPWAAPYGLSVVYAKVDSANVIIERNEDNNLAFMEVLHLMHPDLVAENIYFILPIPERSDIEVQQWEILTIALEVSNQSDIDASDVQIRFYNGNPIDGGSVIASTACFQISAGDSITFTINWHIQNAATGTHYIYAMVDPDNLIPEADEDNNLIYDTVEVIENTSSPSVQVIPTQLEVVVTSGSQQLQNFNVQNYGNSNLEYALRPILSSMPDLEDRSCYSPETATLLQLGSLVEAGKLADNDFNHAGFQNKKLELALSPPAQFMNGRNELNNPGNDAGYAIRLDGTSDYLRIPDIDLSVFTLEAWIYPEGQVYTDNNCLLSKWYHGNNNIREYMLSIMNGGFVRLYYSNLGSDDNHLDTPAGLIQENQWYHLAATLDGESIKIYINGELQAETDWNHTITSSGTGNGWIGTYYDNNWSYNGRIDEIRIWDYARNQSEIQFAMHSQLRSNEQGLAAYWTMDNHYIDMSGNGKTAVPYGDVIFIESEAPIGINTYFYTATDIPLPIGPGAGIVTESVISINDEYLVGDLNITIDIEHTHIADLTLELISPQETSIILSSFNGGAGDNYQFTVFDDEADSYITQGSAPFNGSFIPYPGSLSIFDGELAAGDWTLRITDYCNGDSGMLSNWSMQIRQLSPAWLQISPMAGNLLPLSGDMIDVNFVPGLFYPGTYYADIIVNSNDPVQPQINVITTTIITGYPDIYLPFNELSFDPTYVGFTNSLPLTIYNLGNGDLDITALDFSDPAFSADVNSLSIPMGQTDIITVYYSPQLSQSIQAVMTISNNDEAVSVNLEGNSLDPPTISIDPASFSSSLLTGQQSSAMLTISNLGEDTLSYQTTSRVVPDVSGNGVLYVASSTDNQAIAIDPETGSITGSIDLPYQPEKLALSDNGLILWITYLDAGFVSYVNISDFSDTLSTLTTIELGGTKTCGAAVSHSSSSLNSGFAYIGIPSLNQIDKINLANGEIVSYNFSNINPQALVLSHDGLNLFILGGSNLHVFNTFTEEFIQIGSNYTLGYDLALSPDGKWLYAADRYRIRRYDTENLQFVNEITGLNYACEIDVSPTGELIIVSDKNNNQIRIFDRTLNSLAIISNIAAPVGLVISEDNQWCYVAESGDHELSRINLQTWEIDTEWSITIGNNLLGLAIPRSIAAPWAFTLPQFGDLPPLQSEDIELIMDAQGLPNGSYFAEMWIDSTDPFQPRAISQLSLIVSDSPHIVVSTDSLIFTETVFAGFQDSLNFTITNAGYVDLIISDISNSNEKFQLNPVSFNLPPAASQEVTILFTPDDTALETDTIAIHSNDETVYVQVVANGLLPPVIAISDSVINVTLANEQTVTRELTISNNGYSELVYQAEVSGDNEFCALFDGSGDYVQIPDSELWDFGSADFTVEFWVNHSAITIYNTCLEIGNWNNSILLRQDNSNTFGLYIMGNSYSFSVSPVLNEWLHIAVSRLDNELSLFLNGIQIGNSINSNHNVQVSNVVRIGASVHTTGQYLNGKMDEVRIWNVSKTQQEIQENMHNILNDFEGGLIGYWNFNDADNPWRDFSQYNNDGTAVGNTLVLDSDLYVTPSWLSINSAMSGSILPAASEVIEIDFHLANMLTGVYTAVFKIFSNDPSNPMNYTQINLNYTGMPLLNVSTDSLNFGTVFLGTEEFSEFTVYNQGTDSLSVLSITSTNEAFSVTPSSFGVGIDAEQVVSVQYSPSSAGIASGELLFTANTENTPSLMLSGFCLEPPEIFASPASIQDSLNSGDLADHIITIGNSGVSTLNFNVVCGNLGSGIDGELIVPAGNTYYTDSIKSSLSGINEAGQNSITVADTSGFSIGDELLIISMQDPQTNPSLNLAGQFETHTINDILGNSLSLDGFLQHNFNQIDNLKHQALRIPHFTNVTVNGTITCDNWNGETGGIVFFKAAGQVTVNSSGLIHASGKGYRGHNRQPDNQDGFQGESICGFGTQTNLPNINAGGGGPVFYAGGGGGGHALPGQNGAMGNSSNYGFGGNAIGDAQLTRLYMGGAGGTGGDNDNSQAQNPNGGYGGGIVSIAAISISGDGTIASNGGNGNYSTDQDGGAGGGAAGSILLKTQNFDVGNVRALGGTGFTPSNSEGGKGGNGSAGRIRLDADLANGLENIIPDPYQGNFADSFSYLISANPAQGTLEPGENCEITVSINTQNLAGGNHLDELVIMSNDINNPNLPIPVQLTVFEAAGIATQNLLDFPDTYIDSTFSHPLVIYSNGSDTLNILNLEVLNHPQVFSLSATDFAIPAGDRDTLWVTFAPNEFALFQDILLITSNDPSDPVKEVNLIGKGLDDPVIEVTPEQFEITVLQNDLLTDYFTISNQGGDILEGTIRSVVADTISGTYDDFDDEVWNDTWTEGGSSGSIGLNAGDYVSAPYSLQIYANNYDKYVTSDPFYITDDYLRVGFWYKITLSELSCNFQIFYQKNDGDYNLLFDSPVNQTTGWTYILAETQDVQTGDQIRIRLMSNIYSSSSSYDEFIVRLDDVMFAPLFDFISFSDYEFSLEPGLQQNVSCTFHTDGLDFGGYPAQIRINSNDPENQTVLIPVEVTVPPSILSFSPPNFVADFASGDRLKIYPVITNEGLSRLKGNIYQNLPDFLNRYFYDFHDGVMDSFWTPAGSSGSVGVSSSQSFSDSYSLRIYALDYDKYITSQPITMTSSYLKISLWLKVVTSEISCDFRIYCQKNDNGFELIYDTIDNQTFDWTFIEQDISGFAEPGDIIQVRFMSNIYSSSSTSDQFDAYLDDITIHTEGGVFSSSENYFDLACGESYHPEVTLDASYIPADVYNFQMDILSNDPVLPSADIPFELTILNAPGIAASVDSLSFGNVFIYGNACLPLTISNTGSDLLSINNIILDSDVFSCNLPEDYRITDIIPGESLLYHIYFSPNALQAEADSIIFVSNDPTDVTFVIHLSGTGVEAPQILISPPVMELTHTTQDSIAHFLNITNTGNYPLDYNFYPRTPSDPQMWNYAYVTNYSNNTVSIVNLETSSSQTLPGFYNNPHNIDIDPLGRNLWITYTSSNVISVYNLETGLHKVIEAVGSNRRGSAFSPDGSMVYVADYVNDRIEVYAADSLKLVTTYSTDIDDPAWLDVTPDGRYLYISDTGTDKIIVMDTQSYTQVTTIAGFTDPWGIEISPNGEWFAFRDGNNLKIGSTTTNSIIANVPDIANPRTPVWSPDCRFIYVGSWDANKIHKVETDSFSIVQEFLMPSNVWSVALTEDNNYLLATLANTDNIAIIELETEDISYVNVGDYPTTITTFRTKMPPWLYIEPQQFIATLPPLASDNVELLFDTTQLEGGDHFAELVFSTNDPLNANFVYEITMHHNTGYPNLFITEESISFDPAWIGHDNNYEICAYNTGTEELIIHDISTGSEYFFAQPNQINIAAGGSGSIYLYCNPEDNGTIYDTLSIESNGGSISLDLTAICYPPAIIDVSPQQITNTVLPDEVFQEFITITNYGAHDLVYRSKIAIHKDKYFLGNTNKYQLHAWNADTQNFDSINLIFNAPWFTKFSPDGNQLWVTYQNAGFVSVIDPNSNEVIANILLEGSRTAGIAFDALGTYAYIANWTNNRIEVIDTRTFNLVTSLTGGLSNPRELIATSDGTRLFATNNGNGQLAIFDLENHTYLQSISGYSSGYDLKFSPQEDYLYWIDRDFVRKVEISTNQIVQSSSQMTQLRGLEISYSGDLLYICYYNENKIVILETNTLTQTGQIEGILFPTDISASFDDRLLYVTSEGEHYINIIDIAANRTIDTVNIGTSDIDLASICTADCISYLDVIAETDTLMTGENRQISFNFNMQSLPDGLYHADYTLFTNDPAEPVVNVPVEILIGPNPVITSIDDTPDDQGGFVDITWQASTSDNPDSQEPVSYYSIWRKISSTRSSQDDHKIVPVIDKKMITIKQQDTNSSINGNNPVLTNHDSMTEATRDEQYEIVVGFIPALQNTSYCSMAPTSADSTSQTGIQWYIFKVCAHTSNPGIYYFSLPDSGYSVVNIIPNIPPTITLPDSFALEANSYLQLDFSDYVDDPDGDSLQLSASGFQHIDVDISGLLVTFTPGINWAGSEIITFTVDDNQSRAVASDYVEVIVNPSDIIVVTKNLSPGWNWFSLNVSEPNMSVNHVLASVGDNAHSIRNQTQSSIYYPGMGWFGSLTNLNNLSFYKLDVVTNTTWQFAGLPVNVPETVYNISSGWNWISFAPQVPEDINFALMNLQEVGTNIKSLTQSAIYYPGAGWFGSLNFLQPLDGYMLKTDAYIEFTYPELITGNHSRINLNKKSADCSEIRGFNPHNYEYNAVLIASSLNHISNDSQLLVMHNDEIRSICEILDYSDFFGAKFYSLMLYSNETFEENFQLFYQENAVSEIIPLDYQFNFTADMLIGDFINPVIIDQAFTQNEIGMEFTDKISAYPNPFNPVTTINLELAQNGLTSIDIYNIKGQKVISLLNEELPAGQYSISWNAAPQGSGIYLLHFKTPDSHKVTKLILLK